MSAYSEDKIPNHCKQGICRYVSHAESNFFSIIRTKFLLWVPQVFIYLLLKEAEA